MKNPVRTETPRPTTIQRRPPVHRFHAHGCLACPPPDGIADGTRVPTDDVVVETRPWGGFEQFVCNEQVTVKIITVEPGQRLSLQRHDHRGEMWQVLDGPIDLTLDSRTWTAQPGERVWVPRGVLHRMGSSVSTPARVLEVAFGHFDEDDIQRLEDDYER
jgi:mannose-1-phosphate guanylyltransferase/mannose-6-phosphate isomerase